ncbi:MAG: F0F1 ATP synthase subunit epsilon [Clostridia bacterium]
MSLVKLDIVSPRRLLYSKDVKMVIARAKSGELGIMPGHIPILATLEPGVMRVKLEDDSEEKIAISGGFLEVSNEKITVLARTAELPEEIDIDRALKARERAEKRLKEISQSRVDQARAKAALDRAIARLNVVGKK